MDGGKRLVRARPAVRGAAALLAVALLLVGCGASSVEAHRVDGVTYFTYQATGAFAAYAKVRKGTFSIEDGCVVVHFTPTDEQAHTPIFIGSARLNSDKTALDIDGTTIPLTGEQVQVVVNDVSALSGGATPGLDSLSPCPAASSPVWSLWTDGAPE